jgi:lysophospholipid acyltransferase (LPLAT)-like uncharacterized protein
VPDPSSAESRFTLAQRLQLTLVSWIVPVLLRIIGWTLRDTLTFEEGSIRGLDEIYPGIYPFWHRCVLPAAWLYRKRGLAVMTSRSLDGEFIARVIRRFGYVPVRGSSTRGGQRALLEIDSLLAAGHAAAFTIDGPRGPRYVAKKGPVLLAKMSGAPIIAFYVAVERAWVLKTWDALLIPKPFSRIYVRAARKIFVTPDADDAALSACHEQMQAALERVTAFAESQFCRGGSAGL